MYLFDTDILSHLMKRSPLSALVARVARVSPEEQLTSRSTLGELVYRAHRLRKHIAIPMHKIKAVLLPDLSTLAFDAAVA